MPLQLKLQLLAIYLPDPGTGVVGGGSQAAAIGRPGNTADIVILRKVSHFLAATHLPERDSLLVAARQAAAVGRPGQGKKRYLPGRRHQPAGLGLVFYKNPHAPIRHGYRQLAAVGRPGNGHLLYPPAFGFLFCKIHLLFLLYGRRRYLPGHSLGTIGSVAGDILRLACHRQQAAVL